MEMTPLFFILSFSFGQTSSHRLRTFLNFETSVNNVNWTTAQDICKKNDSNLVTLYDGKDINEIRNYSNTAIWLGHKRATNRSRWSNGKPTTFNQPPADFTVEDPKCEGIYNNTWIAFNCSDHKPFMCSDAKGTYTLIEHQKTWCDALRYCRRRHGDLASISDQDQNIQVIEKGKSSDLPFWIGLLHDYWEWDDEGCSHFRNWKYSTENECTILNPYAKTISTQNCSLAAFTVFCSKGNVNFQPVSEPKLNWEDARDYCFEHYDGMLTIMSQEDQNVLEARMKREPGLSGHAWVGLRQSRILGFWMWTSDVPVKWHNWEGGRAPEMPLSNNCGAVDLQGFKWSDQNCLVKRPFICEWFI